MNQPVKVSDDSMSGTDHFRAQVNLPDRLHWGVLYNCLYTYNSALSASLRDELAEDIQQIVLKHTRALLMGSKEYRWYFKSWTNNCAEPNWKERVAEWIKGKVGDIIPTEENGQS